MAFDAVREQAMDLRVQVHDPSSLLPFQCICEYLKSADSMLPI